VSLCTGIEKELNQRKLIEGEVKVRGKESVVQCSQLNTSSIHEYIYMTFLVTINALDRGGRGSGVKLNFSPDSMCAFTCSGRQGRGWRDQRTVSDTYRYPHQGRATGLDDRRCPRTL